MIESAWDGGGLVGVYGLVPLKFAVGGEYIPGALSDVAVTHPEYRRRGIFSALGKSLYRRAEEAGIRVIYGFATEHNRHGLVKKLGWNCLRDYRDMVRWGGGGGGGGPGTAVIRPADTAGEEFDFLEKRLAAGQLRPFIRVARGSGYIDWRFVRHPEKRYSIFICLDPSGPAGYTALRLFAEEGGKFADIVDIAAVDLACFREMIRHALRYCAEEGCVRARLRAGSVFCRAAAGEGFREWEAGYFFGGRSLRNGPGQMAGHYYTMADLPDA